MRCTFDTIGPRGRAVATTLAALTILTTTCAAQSNVDYPRFPSISPDGAQVVFSWRGDLWIASSDGGQARRLTSHPASETNSAWSPDGDWIAFNSQRDGSNDIWMIRPNGTDVRQVSELDQTLALSGFGRDADGNHTLLFSSTLGGDVYRSTRPFRISTQGGDITRIHDAFGSQPVMSRNGAKVAFVRGGYYSGFERRHSRGPETMDIWIWNAKSGAFTQITDRAGNEGHPQWRNNEVLVYMSDQELEAVNLFAINTSQSNARPRRLTNFKDRDIREFAVSADGKTAVLTRWDALYTLDLSQRGSQPKRITITANEDESDNYELRQIGNDVRDAALSPDGQVMAYVAYGEIYVRNIEDDSPTRRVTNSHARDREVAWSPDGLKLYFVSDRDGTESIYAATVEVTRSEIKESFQQVVNPEAPEEKEDDAQEADNTDNEKPSEADKPIAVEDDGVSGTWSCTAAIPEMGDLPFELRLTVHDDNSVTGSINAEGFSGPVSGTYAPGNGTLTLSLSAEDGTVVEMQLTVDLGILSGTGNANGVMVEINGSRTAGPQGPAEQGQQVSDTSDDAEAPDIDLPRELDPTRWHDAVKFNIEPVVQSEFNDRMPQASPDGKHLSFKRTRGDLVLLDLETGEQRTVFEHWDAGLEWRFSPDGSMIAYARSDMDFNADIFIEPTDGSWDAVNITRHPDNESNPRWSADGKILSFVSERVNEEFDVYMVFLDSDLEGLPRVELDDYFEKAAKQARQRKPLAISNPDDENESDAEESEPDADDAKPGADLELNDAWLRLRRVTSLDGNETNLEMTPAGDLLVFNGSYGGSGSFSVKWDGSGRKRLSGPLGTRHMSLTGDKLVFVSGGRAGYVNPNGGSPNYVNISDRIRIDLQAQASQKFKEAARFLGDMFYHPTMKGLDWEKLTADYHELARSTRTPGEFNDVANRLLGELSASHLGVRSRGGYRSENAQSHGRLGTTHERVVLDDGRHGFKITSILRGAPTGKGEMALKEGDVIIAIDLREIGERDTIETMLKGRVGEELPVTLIRTMEDGKTAELTLLQEPISSGQERSLMYDDWRLSNAERVHAWSDGRLGYIHIQGMNQPSLDVFERDLFAAANGKDGLIIDVRNNGGGWTADRLLASIMVQPHAYTIPRGAPSEKGHYPQDRLFIQRYTLPINMMCNEKSFSNAEITAHAFKTLERGTLVGQETWGGVISTGAFTLIDGSSVRLPFRGWYVEGGTDMENHGAVPDIIVTQTPEAESRNYDEQLRAAVDDLLDRLD